MKSESKIKSEQQIQTELIAKLKYQGYFVTKLIKTSTNGIGDILALRDGKATIYEVKREDGKLSELQQYRIDELKNYGITTKVIYGKI